MHSSAHPISIHPVPDHRPRTSSLHNVILAAVSTVVLFLMAGYETSCAQSVDLVELAVDGAVVTDVQLIKNVSGLQSGQAVEREDIQNAVHRVFGLHLFKDVKILAEEVTDGVNLTIRVVELPRLNLMIFKGNKKLKEDDFALGWRRSQTIGPHQLKVAETTIRRAYQAKGFFLVKVQSELIPTAVTGEQDVVFTIEENSPVKVEAVEFVGNERLSDGELRKQMSNKPRGFLKSIFGGGKFDRQKYSEDLKAVIDRYREKGYLDAMVTNDTIILNETKTDVTLRLTINEGPRYYFGTSEITGMSVLSEKRLRRALKYKEGDVFDQSRYEETVGRMYESYMEEGYLYARIIDDTRTQDSTVNVSYEISEGVPAHVHRINITGNGKTKDKVIRRELTIFPGDIFRRSALQRSMRNVMLLNYFANVVPEFRQLPDGRVDLDFKVEEKPTGQIQVGGGYSEQDRLVGTINLGVPNLFGNGQSADLLLEFGSRRQSFRLGFTEPWFMDTPTTVGFDIQKLSRIWDDPFVAGNNDFTQNTIGATLRLGRRLRWPDDYFSVFWNYRWEDQEYTDFSTAFGTSTRDALTASANGIISSTSITVLRDSRNLPQFATAGSRTSYRLEVGTKLLNGDWNFTKHNLTFGFFQNLWKGFTLAPRWTVAIVQSGPSLTSVPYSELFFAGGIRSDGMIRGYNDRSIVAFVDTSQSATAPETIPGEQISDLSRQSIDTVRGQALLVLNAQITFPVVEQQIHGLFFFDAGNVWLDAAHMAPLTDMWTAYGFGFRIAIPGMGMLGFDFGIPLRGVNKGKLKPHFQFGGAF